MKKVEAMEIIARHAIATLPDSVGERRQVLDAILAACPKSRYAGKISFLLEHLEQHQSMLERKNRSYAGPLAEAFGAVEECRAKPLNDPIRILIFLEDANNETGLAGELVRRFNAIRTRASPVGRKIVPCLPKNIQDDPAVLVVEKACHLSRQDLDAFRRLVNRVKVVLVLLATEEIWRKWNERWPMETKPIRRRAHAIVHLTNQQSNQDNNE